MVLEHLAISGVLVPLHELKKIRLFIFWLKPSGKFCKSGQGHFSNGCVIRVSGGLLIYLVEMADDEFPLYNKHIWEALVLFVGEGESNIIKGVASVTGESEEWP
jgi:hypothetical protein